ncbi:MAG: DUF4494 domain-containing protein [Cytophagaceae bacterium]|nr:DUF4494 domain-containing protein [Cytophagaceae bacterium]
MATWFLAKIKYTKEIEPEKFKVISEAYLFDAVSYADAEARLHEQLATNAPAFQLTTLTPMKLVEVFHHEGGEQWYKLKVVFISYDEQTQQEKKVPHLMLVNAETPKQAYERVEESLGRVDDYTITDVNLTPILEVFPYEAESRNLRPLAEVMVAKEPTA